MRMSDTFSDGWMKLEDDVEHVVHHQASSLSDIILANIKKQAKE